MIAKNKGDFLYNLHNELHRIGIDDDEEIFADFEDTSRQARRKASPRRDPAKNSAT